MINEEVSKLFVSIKQHSNVTPEYIADYQSGVTDISRKKRLVLTAKIDALMDELQIDASGSATIEADRDGFNKGHHDVGECT